MNDWVDTKDRLPTDDGKYKCKCTHHRHHQKIDESECYIDFYDGMFSLSLLEEYGEECRYITHWKESSQ